MLIHSQQSVGSQFSKDPVFSQSLLTLERTLSKNFIWATFHLTSCLFILVTDKLWTYWESVDRSRRYEMTSGVWSKG